MSSLGPASLIVLSLALALAAAALHQVPRHEGVPLPPARPTTFAARCAVQGAEARSHAQALEQRALLHWQRAPFEAAETARATQLVAEAEVCYRAAGDRGGAQRTASNHRRYAAESARRERVARVRAERRLAVSDDGISVEEVEP